MRMRPSPEVAMAITTVVSLHSEAQGITFKDPVIQHDLAGNKRIGMRRSRESNPTLVAHRDAKCRTVADVPGKRVPVNLQPSPAGVLVNFIDADSEVEWILPSGAEVQAFQRKPLDETLRFSISRKPGGPYLQRRSEE